MEEPMQSSEDPVAGSDLNRLYLHQAPLGARALTGGAARQPQKASECSADLFSRSAVLPPVVTNSRGPHEQVRATSPALGV